RSSAERVFVQAVSAPLTAGRIAFQGDNVVTGPIAVGADYLLLMAPDLRRVTTVTVGGPLIRQVTWRDDHKTLLTYAWEGTGDLTVRQNDQIQATRTLDAPLSCAEWQPNGSFVAVCADTGVELWNPADNATVTLFHSAPESLGRTTKAAWSADGRWLAAWQDRVDRHDRAEALAIAHMPVGPAPLSFSLPAAAVILPGGIRAAAWSPAPEPGLVTVSSTGVLAIRPFITRDTITSTAVMTRSLDARLDGVAFVDAARFVIWGKGAQGDLSFWTLDGNREDVAGGPLEDIDGVSVAPDMRHLVAFHGDGHATVVDLESMEVTAALWGHQRPIGAAAWHPQRPVIATAAGDGTARIWSLDGPALGVLTGHVNADAQVALVDVVAVRWQSDGRHLVTAGEDGSLRMWEVFGQDGYPYCAGGQDTGLPFCFGFSQVADDQTGSFEQLVWREDLLVTTAWDGAIHGYRPRADGRWSHESIAPGGDEIDQVLLNSQGTLALVQLHTGAAHVLDLATGVPVLSVDPPVTTGIWLDRGLLLNHEEGTFTLYDLATWHARAGRDPTGAAITAAALAPDGRLATGHLDGRTLIWQVGDQDELILLLEIPPFAHGDGDPARLPITWMTWRRDGLGVISVGETVSLWDATNGDLRWSYLEPATRPIVAQVDPAGAHLAVARDRSLAVLDVATGAELWRRVASGDIIQGVQWLTAPAWPVAVTGAPPDRSVNNGGAPPARSLLLLWAGDGTANVWDWRNDAEILELAQDDPLARAAASVAGQHIATTYTTFTDAGVMDILRIWDTWLDAPEEGVAAAREQLTRPLQPDQRREFALGD
ncbi:MAG: hypothetical protein KDD78_12220, partial [Caldilineaceae bacterium]|nr:hypothetical protein [Caldilineaceae bacterium]